MARGPGWVDRAVVGGEDGRTAGAGGRPGPTVEREREIWQAKSFICGTGIKIVSAANFGCVTGASITMDNF